MSRHQYPINALLPDYLRAGAGMAASLLPLGLVDLIPAVSWGLTIMAGLFLGFAGRTFLRQMSRIEMDSQAIRVIGPLSTTLPWKTLRALDLRYFSTRRDRTGGWMQLKLRGAGGSIRIDSSLGDFDRVARQAAAAALGGGVPISSVARANFAAIEVRLDVPCEDAVQPTDRVFGQGARAE